MTDMTPGSRWLLPVTVYDVVGFGERPPHHVKVLTANDDYISIFNPDLATLIPADRITELEGEVERLKAQADNQTRIALEHWYSGIKTAVTFMHETAKLLNEPGARAAMNTAAHALALEAKRKMAA